MTKIGRKEEYLFQLDKVQNGFGDERRFKLICNGRIVILVRFCKQDRDFDDELKKTVEQKNNGCNLVPLEKKRSYAFEQKSNTLADKLETTQDL